VDFLAEAFVFPLALNSVQRFFWAATIRARASGERVLFPFFSGWSGFSSLGGWLAGASSASGGAAGADSLAALGGRPGLRFAAGAAPPVRLASFVCVQG
jgi:hypothetical protein